VLLALVAGTLVALAPPSAAQTEPAGHISPELDAVPVDSFPYRALRTQTSATADSLSAATRLVASSRS
jgi:hypothetical protein